MGGNKLRKLDYVLHEAIDAGADTLVSGGVVQSNSQRQVAAAAAKLGLDCHLAVYHGRLAPPSAEYEKTGNALLNRLFGATLHDVPWNGDRNGAIRALAERLRERGPQALRRALRRLRPAGRRRPMPRPSSRSRSSARRSASCPAPSSIARAAPARRPAWSSAPAPACPRTRIVGIDIDAEPERVRADVLAYGRAAAGLLDQPFDEATSRSWPAMPARPTACRTPRRSRRSGSAPRSKRWCSIRSIPARVSPA